MSYDDNILDRFGPDEIYEPIEDDNDPETDDEIQIEVTEITGAPGTLWFGSGTEIESGDHVHFAGEPRYLSEIARVIEQDGDTITVVVPPYLVLRRIRPDRYCDQHS